eukprot:g7627.t1
MDFAGAKVAYLFLIHERGGVRHQRLWAEQFAAATEAWSLYVHSALPAEALQRGGTLPFFLAHTLAANESAPSAWGRLVLPMCALLRAALRDPANRKFAFVSGSTVPVKRLDTITRTLLHGTGRCSAICFAPPSQWPGAAEPKAHQWSVLDRAHAHALIAQQHLCGSVGGGRGASGGVAVRGPGLRALRALRVWQPPAVWWGLAVHWGLRWWRSRGRPETQADEVAFTTALWRLGLQEEVVHRCFTFVWWGRGGRALLPRVRALVSLSRKTRIGRHPATFTAVPLRGLQELVTDADFLFARKFSAEVAVIGVSRPFERVLSSLISGG